MRVHLGVSMPMEQFVIVALALVLTVVLCMVVTLWRS
jgi:hypothetical protein